MTPLKNSFSFLQSLQEQHLFETEVFSNIINVLIVTLDQFNVSLLNESIIIIFFFNLTTNFWMVN